MSSTRRPRKSKQLSPRTNKPSTSKSTNQIRIIAGQWRGRKLSFPDSEGLRPTGDRIRETLFNWLQPSLPGANCLDAFAGAGALGFEALSREAAQVTLLEKSPGVFTQLQSNLKLLNAAQGKALNVDTLSWLTQNTPETPFDIVFLDPPFQDQLLEQTAQLLEQCGWLAPSALIYLEHPRKHPPVLPNHWQQERSKQAGDVCYQLFSRPSSEES